MGINPAPLPPHLWFASVAQSFLYRKNVIVHHSFQCFVYNKTVAIQMYTEQGYRCLLIRILPPTAL
jgi:hypothetical protein